MRNRVYRPSEAVFQPSAPHRHLLQTSLINAAHPKSSASLQSAGPVAAQRSAQALYSPSNPKTSVSMTSAS